MRSHRKYFSHYGITDTSPNDLNAAFKLLELHVARVWLGSELLRCWLGVGEASVPYGPEIAKSGTAEGKPQVEQYGLDELAASAEAVVAGWGRWRRGWRRLAVEAGRAVTLDAMEVLVAGRGRELLRGLVQLALDAQASARCGCRR